MIIQIGNLYSYIYYQTPIYIKELVISIMIVLIKLYLFYVCK